MTASGLPHLPSFKRLFAQVGSRYALSYQTMIAFAVPALGAGFVFEQTRFEQAPIDRIGFVVIGYLATLVPLIIARFFLPDRPRESRPIAVLTVFVVAGFVRGFTLAAIGTYFGTGNTSDNLYRIFGAPVFVLVTLTVCTILVSNYRRHREALENLANERHSLQLRSAGIRALVELQREELLTKVRETLSPAIQELDKKFEGSKEGNKAVIESLKSTVEDVVRPLTNEVAAAADDLKLDPPRSRLREAAELPERISLGEFVLPLIGALVTTAALIPSVFWIEDAIGAIVILSFVFTSMLLVLLAYYKIFAKVYVSPFVAAAIVPLMYGSALATLHVHNMLWFFTVHATPVEINAAVLYAAILGATFFYAQLVQLQRAMTLKKFSLVNRQLEVLNAWLRQQLWLNRRRTASTLHGPIQAALYAAAMKLAEAKNPEPELIAEVRKDIEAAIAQLGSSEDDHHLDFREVLGQIADLWGDTAQVEISIDPLVDNAIVRKPLASEALVEVVREFVNNAIKHGSAKSVKVSIAIEGGRLLVKVVDDGEGIEGDSAGGFGSKLLDELTLSWTLERVDDTTVASAEIVTGRDSL